MYIRYIGAGMVTAGGFISLVKTLPLIISTFVSAIKGMKGSGAKGILRTEKELSLRFVVMVFTSFLYFDENYI